MNSQFGAQGCPVGGKHAVGVCPATGAQQQQYGPRGCGFIGFQADAQQMLYGTPTGPNAVAILEAQERKTLCEVLLPEAPPKEQTKNMPNADSLNPPELDVLAMALGAPARRVLQRADAMGPLTGWRDGYLSTRHGFCPPDPSAAATALALSPGRIWSDLCSRLTGLINRGRVRESILELPLVEGTPDVIPDAALWAAVVCLGILASIYRYEERNDGHEGIVKGARPSAFTNIHGDPDEEPETKGIPRNIVIPLRQICTRLGRALPYLSQADVSIHNIKIRDHTSIYPYLERTENCDLRWPIFNDRGEAGFLLAMIDTHGCFTPAVNLIASCQEKVMLKDNEGLLRDLIALKLVVDQLPHAFHKISLNPKSGENYSPPVFWGQGYAKFSAPLSKRVPALSGLFLPLFQTMDAFLRRKNYSSFLGIEAVHLRAWMPLNIRAFLAAIENYYSVPDYVKASGDPRLIGVLDSIVEAYAGERGFMGTHRYKVYGFLECVAKTGRVETNGNAGASDTVGRPWQEVHRTLSASMIERLEPYRKSVTMQPHEMRGTYEECRFRARIVERSSIDDDPTRSTGKVTFDLRNTGLTFTPGDRLAIMPLNAWRDVEKVVGALGLMDLLDVNVPLDKSEQWKLYAKHEADIAKREDVAPRLTVRDILRKGQLAPLTKEMVMAVHSLVRVSSVTLRVLGSDTWPVNGSLGDLLVAALNDVPENVWDAAFDLNDLSWLPALINLEVPRTYSISNAYMGPLPDFLDLTVARSEHAISPLLLQDGGKKTRPGVCSGFLNPDPSEESVIRHPVLIGDDPIGEVLVGISRPLNFQLPISAAAPCVMFAGGSGIAPFRGFWQERINSGGIGRNILFLGVQSRKKFLYKRELREHVLAGRLELHVAFSRDTAGLVYDRHARDLVEKTMEPRYIDAAIVDQGSSICDLVTSTKVGGLGGSIYICGSVSLYESVITGIRRALYNHRAVTQSGADALLATAFAERRLLIDVFMTPRAMSENEPVISLAELARHTGHRDGSKMWIGVHGSVYDITDFLDIHPGGTLIVAASAGLDASVTFDEVAHTNNPEVSSLLSKYFIGRLAEKPSFQTPELNDLWDSWVDYLRTCVESITTLSFEVESLMKDTNVWFAGGMLNSNGLRKFYQFQSRLMQNGFPMLFGAKLQELFVKLSFSIASAEDGSLLPDVVGTVAHANSSPSAISARKEIADIGEFVLNSGAAQSFEHGIINYAQTVTELDVRFLEQIRNEICEGLDAFERVAGVIKSYPAKEKQALHKISTVLMSYLERIAERLDGFYVDLAAQSLYHPEKEANPARARWGVVRRRVKDNSFFVLTRDMSPVTNFDKPLYSREPAPKAATRRNRQSITFDQVLSQAVKSVNTTSSRSKGSLQRSMRGAIAEDDEIVPSSSPVSPPSQPRRRGLADAHTERAAEPMNGPSSYEEQLASKAANRMSKFVSGRMKDIRRLSRATNFTALEHAFPAYGASRTTSNSTRDRSDTYRAPQSASGSSSSSSHSRSASRPVRRATQDDDDLSSVSSREYQAPPSEAGTVRTTRTVRSPLGGRDLHSATFNRKLSLMKLNGADGSGKDLPLAARKPNHW